MSGCYIEFIGVVDEEQAGASPFGRWVAASPAGVPFGWAVRTNAIETVAERLGIEVADGARGDLRWKLAGVAEAIKEPCLPFFIQWAPDSRHPGNGTGGFAELQLTGDPERLAAWLGPHDLPISIHPGTPSVSRVVLTGGVTLP